MFLPASTYLYVPFLIFINTCPEIAHKSPEINPRFLTKEIKLEVNCAYIYAFSSVIVLKKSTPKLKIWSFQIKRDS